MSSKIRFLLPILLFVFTFVLYIHHLSKSVFGGDVGDLVTAAAVGGVPHPPGYPLFTLLGFILTRFNFSTPAFMVGLISAFSSSLAILFFHLLVNHLTKNKLITLLSSLILAFSYFFWFYAEIAEVFALNNLFVILLFYLAVIYGFSRENKILFLLSFILGLSLTNHHTIILIFPSLIIIILKPLLKVVFKNLKIVLVSSLFFILGFSLYLYVPIASSFNPPVNWDRVKDLPSFLHLLLRKDYGTFNAGVFASPNFLQRLIILKVYFLDLITQLTPPVVIVSLLGGLLLFLKNRLLFISLFLGFVLSGPVFVAYAGFPLFGSFFVGIYERFFITSSIILLLFFSFGLIFIVKGASKIFSKKTFSHLVLGVFIVIPIFLFNYNFPKTNLHNVWIGDYLAYDFLSPLPKNTVLLLSGDTVLFNSWYLHYVLNVRPDAQVVNLNGLAGDAYLEKERRGFVKKYPKLEKDQDLVIKVIEEIAKNRPVFSYNGVQPKKGKKLSWIPYGLSFKLTSDTVLSKESYLKETSEIWQKLHVPKKEDRKNLALGSLSISEIPSIYANASLATGNFFLSTYRDEDLAFTFYEKALGIDPNYAKTYEVLGAYYLSKKECSSSEKNLKRAIGLSPFDKLSYYFLYTVYKSCFKNNTMASEVVSNYRKVSETDLLKEMEEMLK